MIDSSNDINPLIDALSYAEASAVYEKKADVVLSSLDTIILVGDGAKVNVRNRALVLYHGRTHVPQEEVTTTLYAGAHRIRRLVILSDDGYITFEAINWCHNHGIAILMLDRDGNAILSSGEYGCDVELRRLQYQADDTGIAGQIARELVRLKTLAQIETLKTIKTHPIIEGRLMVIDGRRVTFPEKGGVDWGEFIWESFENDLSVLSGIKDIDTIRAFEGSIALKYWTYLTGIPIYWSRKDEKIVPPHWKAITERGFSNSGGGRPRQALSPFHAVLNYAYGILEAQVLSAINVSGLDPACGCLHYDKIGRNSLVYDLMEPHRPQVDSLVLSLFAKTTFTRGMLVPLDSGEVRLSKQFARYVVASCMLPLDTISETVGSFVKIYRGIIRMV